MIYNLYLSILVLTSSFIFTLACTPENTSSSGVSARINRLTEDNTTSSSNRGSSRCDESKDGDLSISRANDITSNNVGEYRISGRCSIDDGDIKLSVSGSSKALTSQCSGRRWEEILDLTKEVHTQEEVRISVEAGSRHACSIVRNSFLCPKDYVPVPPLEDDSDVDVSYSFCVMKYEARSENSQLNNNRNVFDNARLGGSSSQRAEDIQEEYNALAVVKSGGKPWTNISVEEAQRRCRNNGAGYQLISNGEWQTIARSIELTDVNWFLEKTDIQDNNYLKQGDSRSSSSVSLGDSRSSSSSSKHTLLNELEIWDIAGGVGEMVSDSARSLGAQETRAEYVFELTGKNKQLFGPKRDYRSVGDTSGIGISGSGVSGLGLGIVRLNSIDDTIVRGGGGFLGGDSGVFSVSAESQSSIDDVGFRCTYHP